ncbi:MAG: hypothetical protein Q4P33_03820 [Flaviflexus sp.]|nr:hypothetical protein [Flaviflexus sp.]
MSNEHVEPVDSGEGLAKAIQLHRPSYREPWRYGTALTDPRVFTPQATADLLELLHDATRLGVDALDVSLSGIDPADPIITSVMRRAGQRGIGVSLRLHDDDETIIKRAPTWLGTGVLGFDVTDRPHLAAPLAEPVVARGEDRIRTMLVTGPDLAPLEHHLREDWVEITRSDALLHIEWTPDKLIDLLTRFYSLHASTGSQPAWDISVASSRPEDRLGPAAKILAMLALPGSLTLGSDLVSAIPNLRRILRYRSAYRLQRAPLSYLDRGELHIWFTPQVAVLMNVGDDMIPAPCPGQVLSTTGSQVESGRLWLAPRSTTWCSITNTAEMSPYD